MFVQELVNDAISKLSDKNLSKEEKANFIENVAIEKSISDTAIKGGNLGWIEENSISIDLKSKIVNTKVGEVSEPFFLPKGILFFKVSML